MKLKFLIPAIVAVLAIALPACAQNGVLINLPPITNSQGQPLAGVTISVFAASGTFPNFTCNTPATVYKDQALTVPFSPLVTDGFGNFPFYIATSGSPYGYTVSGVNTNSTICYGFMAQLAAGSSPNFASLAVTGNETVGGTLGVTGTTTLGTVTATGPGSFKNLENVRYVSPSNTEGWSGSTPSDWANSAATDLGGSGTVVFATGTYTISTGKKINLASNIKFQCAGYRTCILNAPGYTTGDIFFQGPASNISNCAVDGFKMVGGSIVNDNRGISNQTGFSFTQCSFTNNEITNTFDGIDAYSGSTEVTISGNFIHSWGQQGITVQGNYNHVTFNTLDTGGTTNLHHAIYAQEGVGGDYSFNRCLNVAGFCVHNFSVNTSGVISGSHIIGDYCTNCGTSGSGTRGCFAFAETPPSTGNRQGEMADLVCENTNGTAQFYISATTHAVVHDLTARNYQGDCADILGSSSFTTGELNVHDINCSGGSTSGVAAFNINKNGGNIQWLNFHDNTSDGNFGICIWAQGLTDGIIHHNTCKDWNLQGSFSNAGIRVESTTLRTLFDGNTLSTANTTGSPNAIYIPDAASVGNTFALNRILNFGAGTAIADSGSPQNRQFCNEINTSDSDCLFGALGGGLVLSGSSSGTSKLTAPATAGTPVTLPPAAAAFTAGTLIPLQCVTSQKSESGADANVLTCTPPAVAGSYRVRFELSVSAANTATLGWTATWTDSSGNAQTPTNLSLYQSGTAAPALTFATSAAGNYYGDAQIDINNAAANIVIKLTFSGTSFTGKASASVERVI